MSGELDIVERLLINIDGLRTAIGCAAFGHHLAIRLKDPDRLEKNLCDAADEIATLRARLAEAEGIAVEEISDAMVDRAMAAFTDAINSTGPCSRCDGKGYHHGFGEYGHDPDWCEVCGGSGFVPGCDDKTAMKKAIEAALPAAPQPGKGGSDE